MANKTMKRKYVIGLFILLAMATVSTYAWTANETYDSDPSLVYVTDSSATATVTEYSSRPIGKNKIQIKFTLDAGADVEFMFLNSTTGDVVVCDQDVELNSVDIEDDITDGYYEAGTLAATEHTIEIKGTGVWKDLNSLVAGQQEYDGIMIVIK